MRQLLADKISGTQVGLWLLIPEHLRLGTWDLLCGWSGQAPESVWPRLAMQLVHESALCVAGIRRSRSLSQKGFELANGLPFVATDQAMHELLGTHTVAQAQQLQIALGKLRRASGHFPAQLLAIDPHRIQSYSKRQMVRFRQDDKVKAAKVAQTFFCLDAHSNQPLCFTMGSAARTVSEATPELLRVAQAILDPLSARPLVVADCEHFNRELITQIREAGHFDLLVPMPRNDGRLNRYQAMPESDFTLHWAGYATARRISDWLPPESWPAYEIIQRTGVGADSHYQSFLATGDRPELQALSQDFPQRWHIEEFFKSNQALGWQRAGTFNLNIRYGQMTMALMAQAVIHQMRQRLGPPFQNWDATHLAKSIFGGLEGDVRVENDTIVVTYYNAPNAQTLRQHYEDLPTTLAAQGIKPQVPWLYDLKLDFRFR